MNTEPRLRITTDSCMAEFCYDLGAMSREYEQLQMHDTASRINGLRNHIDDWDPDATVGEFLAMPRDEFFQTFPKIDVVKFPVFMSCLNKYGLTRVDDQTFALERGWVPKIGGITDVASLQTKFFEQDSASLELIKQGFEQYYEKAMHRMLSHRAGAIQIESGSLFDFDAVKAKLLQMQHQYDDIMTEKIATRTDQLQGTEQPEPTEKEKLATAVAGTVRGIKVEMAGLLGRLNMNFRMMPDDTLSNT